MNVFSITKTIRRTGHNYGVPCWLVEFGPGTSYTPETLLEHLAKKGLQPKDLVVMQNGLSEKGIGKLVAMLSYLPCKSEVEAKGHETTPAWFTSASCWVVYWEGRTGFNIGALRRGQDMLISKDLDSLIRSFGKNELMDKGYASTEAPTTQELEVLFACRIRSYVEEATDNLEEK